MKLIVQLFLPFIITGLLSFSIFADNLDDEIQNLEDFSTAYNLIKSKYIKEKNSKDLIISAISGMVRELDPYSDVLTADDLEKLELQSVGQYVGIGVSVNQDNNKYLVTQVYKGSPADKKGIKAGDEIIAINGNLLSDRKGDEINDLLDGELDETLTLEYRRGKPETEVRKVTLKRSIIKANSVECFSFSDLIGVFTVHQFLKHTAFELEACLKDKSYRSVILDLRNNPGGLLISAVEVTDLFVDIGKIVLIKDRENRIIENYVARKQTPKNRPFLVMLINNYSASASEIVAGAIKDRKSGILVGENSYGKGVVQSIYPIGDDLYIKITTALYYTPSEISFDGVGVEPDFEVKDSLNATKYGNDDLVFQKALDIVRLELNSR